MLKTEFIEERKEGETISFRFKNNEGALLQSIRGLRRKINRYRFVVSSLLIWNLVLSIGFGIGFITIHNDLKYPQDATYIEESSVEDEAPIINEDLSSFTLVPPSEIPKK